MSKNKKEANDKVESKEEETEIKEYDLSDTNDLVSIIKEFEKDKEKVKYEFSKYLKILAEKNNVANYEIIFLFDDITSISTYHSNQIYEALSESDKKDILLVISSGGGKIEPAYLISKTCKKLKNDKFCVSVPRQAKSAATLISLGADEIHMGLLSELGPIDPQFSGFPASGLGNAMEKIAEMSSKYPASSDMFAKYLTENVNIRDLGYFERINESATQYAERLLAGKELADGWNAKDLSDHLTNHYKDHGFVIDSEEAATLLGNKIIKEGTDEYKFGNDVYSFLDFANWLAGILINHNIRLIGGIENGILFNENEKK